MTLEVHAVVEHPRDLDFVVVDSINQEMPGPMDPADGLSNAVSAVSKVVGSRPDRNFGTRAASRTLYLWLRQ
jgi:hypothetical protein